MEKIIFACCASSSRKETLILMESIRKYGGNLAKQPVWLFVPEHSKQYVNDELKELEELEITIIPFKSEIENKRFPFVTEVNCTAYAEKLANDKCELLVWLAVNQFFIKEPSEFILAEDKNYGYRPVHHKLIGSKFDEPIDEFWSLIYEKCNTPIDKIFPMKTHIDGEILRPYINSGFQVVRPKIGFFNKWWNSFREIFQDPVFKKFYEESDLYTIFIHQAVLSALMLEEFKLEEIVELSSDYNYPIHLFEESLDELKPKSINDLTIARFYLNKLQEPNGLERIPITGKLKDWLLNRLEKIKLEK